MIPETDDYEEDDYGDDTVSPDPSAAENTPGVCESFCVSRYSRQSPKAATADMMTDRRIMVIRATMILMMTVSQNINPPMTIRKMTKKLKIF